MASENTASTEQRAQGLLVSEVSMRMWVMSIDAKIRGCREDVAGSMGAFQAVESIRKWVFLDLAGIQALPGCDMPSSCVSPARSSGLE